MCEVSEIIEGEKRLRFGRGKLGELNSAAEEIAAEGSKILLIADGRKADEIHGLLSRKFRTERTGKINPTRGFALGITPPEDAKLIVSAGGTTAASLGKYAAERFKLPLIHVATDPSNITYFTPSARLTAGGAWVTYKTAPPVTVIADTAAMSGDETDIAAAFGAVCSRLAAVFDTGISALIHGEKYVKQIERGVLSTVKSLLYAESEGELDVHTAATHAAAIAVLSGGAGDSRLVLGGADQVRQAFDGLSERAGKMLKKEGESLMPISLVVMRTYLTMAAMGSCDGVRVPDNNMRLDVMAARLGISPLIAVNKLDECVGAGEQARRLYILRECKGEIIAKCRVYEKLTAYAYKRFKRLYKDKGFSYNEYLNARDLKTAVGIAPDMNEKFTFFTLMKQTGLLDGLLAG